MIISPSQTIHTYWKNSPDGEVRTEDMLKRDLNAHLTRERAHISQQASQRGIFGISMGGHGATYMAMKHPRFYGAGMYAISPIFRDEKSLQADDVRGCGRGADFKRRDPTSIFQLQGRMPLQNFQMEIAPDDSFLRDVPSTQQFFNTLARQ